MIRGMSMRKTGATAMNEQSSRSHSIFTIYIETSEDVSLSNFISIRCQMAKAVLLKGTELANLIWWTWLVVKDNLKQRLRAKD